MRFLANPHPFPQSHNFCQEDYYEQMPLIQPFLGLQIKLLLTPMNQKYGKGFQNYNWKQSLKKGTRILENHL